MNMKFFVLITIFLFAFVIGGGTVCASQNNMTMDSNEIMDPNIKAGTFSDLNNLIENSSDNDEITLQKDYTYDNDTDSKFSDGIKINKSLTLNGQGHIINADAKAKIFKIHGEVILKNIIFVNAFGKIENNYYSIGVAVNCLNSTKIINCSFKNNHVEGFGSAIYFEIYGHVINCSFINNSATRYGGAVYFENDGYVYNSIFINNTALAGGAIHSNKCKIINSTFLNNFALFGGAIDANNIEIINSTFKDNNATLDGGCIYAMNAIVTYSNFINGSAQDGGAINLLHWGNIHDCNFTNCFAKNAGGAIVFRRINSIYEYEYECNIINCCFLNNHAKFGGAVNFEGSGEIISCKFINNSCESNGGAVNFKYIENKSPFILILLENDDANKMTKHAIINCSFINNDAALGGGIHCEYGDIVNCSFINNTANIGDAIYFKDNKSKLFNSIINGLDYEFNCGYNQITNITPRLIIISNNSYTTHSGEDIVEVEFKSNIANIKIWVEIPELMQKINLTINNFKTSLLLTNLTKSGSYDILCGFNEEKKDNNLSPVVLGYDNILGIVDNKTVEIKFNKNIKSKSNNSFNDLQMLINNCNDKELYLEKDYIYNNDSDTDFNDGICIYKSIVIDGNNHKIDARKLARIFTITSNNVILKNINFVNGNSISGGAIFANNNNTITLINCIFTNNNALDSAGALSLKCFAFSIINCSFINNYARWYGGAISSHSSSKSYIINSVFINNVADYSDGAIGVRNCNVINSSFINNRADYYAGAINLADDGKIINSIFINNYARIAGGAVYTSYLSDAYIVNSTFINNSAQTCGGAISSNVHNKAHIINCNFINNYAIIEGGAIYVGNSDYVIVIGSYFKNNHAKNGCAISSDDYNVLVVNSVFSKDKCVELFGNITLINCHLSNEKIKSKVIIKSKVKIYSSTKKIFKFKNKYKRYSIVLKSNKKPVRKVLITLKINNNIFKSKTNNYGKATFKINKLNKKGKYKGKIIFKGNKYYNSANKYVKIIIK